MRLLLQHPDPGRRAWRRSPGSSRHRADWRQRPSKAGTLIVVALIFGVVNAVIKPIVKTVGCLFYVLTLGLIGLVVNGLLLWLCSWVAGKLTVPFHITGFWPAFWGAIIVGIVGWLLNLAFDERAAGALALPASNALAWPARHRATGGQTS